MTSSEAPTLVSLPTPDELMKAPEWAGLSAGQRSDVVDAWALETRQAYPWDREQSAAIDSALDDFHAKAAEGWGEWAGRVGKEAVVSGASSMAALPLAIPKVAYQEGKAAGILLSDESDDTKKRMLAAEAPDVLKLGQGYDRTLTGGRDLMRQYNPLSNADEEWNASLDALKQDVLDRKLPEDPGALYTALKKHGLSIAQATAKLHGEGTADYLPMEWQSIDEAGLQSVFQQALHGQRVEGYRDQPDDLHRGAGKGYTFKNQSRSLVASPENLGLLLQFSATRNPKYFEALKQRLGRSRDRQAQDVTSSALDGSRREDAFDVATRSIFGLGGYAPGAGDYMVQQVQGLAQSPVDLATTAFSFGLGRAAVRVAEVGLMKTAGKLAMGAGAEFLQGAGSALGDQSVPTLGNVAEQGLMEALAGGVIESAGAGTEAAHRQFNRSTISPSASGNEATAQGSYPQADLGAGSSPATGATVSPPPVPHMDPLPIGQEGASDAEFDRVEQTLANGQAMLDSSATGPQTGADATAASPPAPSTSGTGAPAPSLPQPASAPGPVQRFLQIFASHYGFELTPTDHAGRSRGFRAASLIADKLGLKIQWFTTDQPIKGTVDVATGTLWLNEGLADQHLPGLVLHEALHYMAVQYQDLFKAVQAHFEQLAASGDVDAGKFAAWLGSRGYAAAWINSEEMLAHLAERFGKDEKFWVEAFAANPGLGARLLKFLQQFLQWAATQLRSTVEREAGQFVKDAAAMDSLRSEMAKAYGELSRRARQGRRGGAAQPGAPSLGPVDETVEAAARAQFDADVQRGAISRLEEIAAARVRQGDAALKARLQALFPEAKDAQLPGLIATLEDAQIVALAPDFPAVAQKEITRGQATWDAQRADYVATAQAEAKAQDRAPLSDAVQFDVDRTNQDPNDASPRVMPLSRGDQDLPRVTYGAWLDPEGKVTPVSVYAGHEAKAQEVTGEADAGKAIKGLVDKGWVRVVKLPSEGWFVSTKGNRPLNRAQSAVMDDLVLNDDSAVRQLHQDLGDGSRGKLLRTYSAPALSVGPVDPLEQVRMIATQANAPESESRARPLKPELGGKAADYTAFADKDMMSRATQIVDILGVERLTSLLGSADGARSMGLDAVLQEYVQAESLRRASQTVMQAGNDVDRIRANQALQRLKRLWDVTGTQAGQHLKARQLAGDDLRSVMAVDEAIQKQQETTIDRAVPVPEVVQTAETAAEVAGTEAGESLTQAMNDEEFERRLIPVLQRLMPMRQPEIQQAVAALTDVGANWREQAMQDAVRAVDQQFAINTRTPNARGALRTLLDNMNAILRSKVPRTTVATTPPRNMAEGVARVFLDAQNERALFAESWTRARSALIDRVIAEGDASLAEELRSVLPENPTLWFQPSAAADLFKQAIAELQGRESPRLEDVLVNADRMGESVINRLTQEALAQGMDSVQDPEVQQQMQLAWRDWVDQARGRAMMRERARIQQVRDGLLQQDSGALGKLMKSLVGKISGALDWRSIFTSLPTQQRDWELEAYRRIRLHEALRNLSPNEARVLAREMSKAWQRERRKVWNREMTKQLTKIGKLKPKARAKVEAAAPRLLQLINLGAFDSQTFRDALAKEWGLASLASPEAKRLKDLAVRMQQAPDGLPKRKLSQQFVEGLQDLTKLTKLEILENWWTASVLSGWRTHADILLGVANGIEDVGLGSIMTAIRTGNADVAWRAVTRVIANLPTAIEEALHHIVTGDRSMMRNYDAEVKAALQDGHKLMANAGRQLLRKGGLAKAPGAFMELMARMMTAWDHINSTSTFEGAKMMALAEHPELYQQALNIGPHEKANARAQARSELTAGAAPVNRTERLQEDARVKEILDAGVPQEIIAQASEIGRDAALQGEPTGLGWAVWWMAKKATELTKNAAESMEKDGVDNLAGRLVLAALQRGSTVANVVSGTKFIRTVGNAMNRGLSYVPGLGLIRFAEGSMRGAKADVLKAKQLLGTAVTLALFLRFANSDDDDEMGIEGAWKSLSPAERSQLYSQGKQPNTLWYRDAHGRVVSVNYLQWGIANILATVGSMNDERRYHGNKNTLQVLLNGILRGGLAWTEKAQLQGLQQVFGDSAYSTSDADASVEFLKKLNRYAATTGGGLVPRIFKDVDMVLSPELRGGQEWWNVWAQQVPMIRELTTGKRVDILGNDIVIDRSPTSRIVQRGTSDPAYQMLGQLNRRDLWLPDPSATKRKVRVPGGTRLLTPQEQDKYQRLTGEGYREFLLLHGANLLRLDADRAKDLIERHTKVIRERAAYQSIRR